MEVIRIKTREREEFVEITGRVRSAVSAAGWKEGVLFVFVPHTTAGVFINEDADPSVLADMGTAAGRIAPENLPYTHAEGNSPAHFKSVVFNQSLFVPVENGALALGRWQGIFFAEFDGPREREFYLKFMNG